MELNELEQDMANHLGRTFTLTNKAGEERTVRVTGVNIYGEAEVNRAGEDGLSIRVRLAWLEANATKELRQATPARIDLLRRTSGHTWLEAESGSTYMDVKAIGWEGESASE